MYYTVNMVTDLSSSCALRSYGAKPATSRTRSRTNYNTVQKPTVVQYSTLLCLVSLPLDLLGLALREFLVVL